MLSTLSAVIKSPESAVVIVILNRQTPFAVNLIDQYWQNYEHQGGERNTRDMSSLHNPDDWA